MKGATARQLIVAIVVDMVGGITAAMLDVPNKLGREEFAFDMVHRGQKRFAAMMDVQTT